jgi:hypothetical protein
MIVAIGLTPEAVGKALASPIQMPLVSWSSPSGLATLVAGSCPIRQLPIWCALKMPNSRGASECVVTASMNASRSSPRPQVGAVRPMLTMRSAPADSCSRISSARPRRKLRTSSSSESGYSTTGLPAASSVTRPWPRSRVRLMNGAHRLQSSMCSLWSRPDSHFVAAANSPVVDCADSIRNP